MIEGFGFFIRHIVKPQNVGRNTKQTMSNKLSFLILVVILVSCQNAKIDLKLIVGNWNIKRDVYAKGSLTINENMTFKFSEMGHLSESSSSGTWEIKKDTLILSSTMPKECLYVLKFGPSCENKNIVIEDLIETTVENCEPKSYTKFYTKFWTEKFIIKKDSLIYIITNKNCTKKQTDYKIFR